MHDDLDLRVIERHHDADPGYREELRRRVAAILDGSEAVPPTDGGSPDPGVIDLDQHQPGRPERGRRHWLAAAVAISGAAAAIIAIAVANTPDDDGGVSTDQPALVVSSFVGEWITDDADGSTPTMTVEAVPDGTVTIGVHDTIASECSGAPSSMTGIGQINPEGNLVIAQPVFTCDDASAPTALSGPPLEEQLRNLTFTSSGSDTLTDSRGGTWRRLGVDPTPAIESEQPTSGGMWPQSTIEEVRAAQQLADAGDPDYAWQAGARLVEDDSGALQVDLELVDRFIREVLGWDAYLFNIFGEGGTFSAPFNDNGELEGKVTGQQYLRCAPGRTNPLYPPPPDPSPFAGERCAPTLDDLRYASVSIDIAQLDRQGRDGIWVVTRWERTPPFAQADPAVVEAQATDRLEEFLAARIAGRGAEGHVQVEDDLDVPLLYATTSGAPYERYEIERVDDPRWPYGYMTFAARLFADGDATVVEQELRFGQGDGDPRLFALSTTENGQPITIPYTSADGEVTISAPSTWRMWWPEESHLRSVGVWFGGMQERLDGSESRIGLVDPVAYDAWCADNGGSPLLTAPGDAAAIAQQVVADPNFETTAPAAALIGDFEAVSLDVALAPGGTPCGIGMTEISRWIHELYDESLRLRLYLVDLPEGMSVETLAITVVAPEERFDEVIAQTAPIIESIEFHTG